MMASSAAAPPLPPPTEEIVATLKRLREENPTLGVSRLHGLLLQTHPSWKGAVSEKRVHKLAKQHGLVLGPPAPPGVAKFPTSAVIEDLEVYKWSNRVEVKHFGRVKGKGLVARAELGEGEIVWKEDPFILAPEWEIYQLQKDATACGFCTTPFKESVLIASCPFTESSSNSSHCSTRFCNRLCQSRSSVTHPLLCPVNNPASKPFIEWLEREKWQGVHGLALATAKILLENEKAPTNRDDSWKFFTSLAGLGLEDRYADAGDAASSEHLLESWKDGWRLFLEAFKEPPTPSHQKQLSKILKNPLPKHIAEKLWNEEWMKVGLGRINLNIESHGGVYVLHSHINHSCRPTVAARHLDQQASLPRLSIVALRDMEPGEELTVSYVNPGLPLKTRRAMLRSWHFGICNCERCVEEEAQQSPETEQTRELADELKASFGVL